MKKDATEFPAKLTEIEIYKPLLAIEHLRDEADAKSYAEARQDLKDRLKEIEDIRKRLKDPILEAGKRIDEQARKVSEPLKHVVGIIDTRLLVWDQEQEKVRIAQEEARRDEELSRLEAEASVSALDGDDAKDIEKNITRLEAKPIEIDHRVRTDRATVYVQKRWTFAVVDESIVPREFLLVDEVKLRKYATAMKESAKVPGVKFYEEAAIGGRR